VLRAEFVDEVAGAKLRVVINLQKGSVPGGNDEFDGAVLLLPVLNQVALPLRLGRAGLSTSAPDETPALLKMLVSFGS